MSLVVITNMGTESQHTSSYAFKEQKPDSKALVLVRKQYQMSFSMSTVSFLLIAIHLPMVKQPFFIHGASVNFGRLFAREP